MQPDTLGTLAWLKIARDSIGDHKIQFSKRIALRRDASAAGSVPARHIAASLCARLNSKDDFRRVDHVSRILRQGRPCNLLEQGERISFSEAFVPDATGIEACSRWCRCRSTTVYNLASLRVRFCCAIISSLYNPRDSRNLEMSSCPKSITNSLMFCPSSFRHFKSAPCSMNQRSKSL